MNGVNIVSPSTWKNDKNNSNYQMLAKSAEKRARKSAQMGATWIINSSVYYDAVNKFLPPPPLRVGRPIIFTVVFPCPYQGSTSADSCHQ